MAPAAEREAPRPALLDAATAVLPLVYDISNWAELDVYRASQEVTAVLEQKGFCFINGFADGDAGHLAEKEARALKRAGAMRCTPREATDVFLGPTSSCWTMELADPRSEAPESEENLRKIDHCLHEVGEAIARSSEAAFAEILGRSRALLHHSRAPQDGPAPALVDPEEAVDHVSRASQKKVVLLYYLGPNATVISIAPRDEPDKTYNVITKNPVVIAYRNDACWLGMSTRGVGITVEVDFLMRTYAGLQMAPRDELPVPAILAQWFLDRFEAIADEAVPIENVPFDFQREAALRVHRAAPVRIVTLWHELPSLPHFGGGVAPFEASLLWGQDPVTEICKKRGKDEEGVQSIYSWGGKWDPDEYYDEDPMSASDYKMYTRHFAVLNRNDASDFNPKEFGMSTTEDFTLDHRARMLLESTVGCLKGAAIDLAEVSGKDIGFFVGLSGEGQYWNFLKGEAKIDRHSAQNLSNATMVNRLSYHLQCTGPCVCIDTEESSGMVALDTAVAGLRHGRCGPLSFAGSCQWIANPFETILQCAAGVISTTGRTRVWDETADGFAKGEGAVALLLELRDGGAGAGKAAENTQHVLITGSSTNSKGASSSLAAPSATAFVDVISRAARDARKPFGVADAVEVSAGGGRMTDLVELGVLRKLLDVGRRGVQAVPLRASRSVYGSLGPVCGLVSVARTCALMKKALHGPMLHLRQMLDLAGLPQDDDDGEMGPRSLAPTEAVEARASAQVVGVSAFGSTGTNCHGLLCGGRPAEGATQPRPAKPLSWWPGGATKEAKPPAQGYYIVGTWTAWEWPCKMEEEAEGVYGYTLTMGENNWECFQLWVDEDPEQALHPEVPRAPREARVQGPEGGIGRELCWYITGHSEEVRLVNEVQFVRLQLKLGEAVDEARQQEPRCVLAFAGDYRPPGHEDAQDESGMPLVNVNEKFAGQPGDKYRIRLHVRSKYKRLEWSKLAAPVGPEGDVEGQPYRHKYHIIGDHSYWSFEEMQPAEGQEGLHAAEVQLLREESNFQIYRDRDWEQGFYPSRAASGDGAEVLGPDTGGHGKHWQIVGKVGDRFRVEFRRRRVADKDERTLRWEFVGPGEVNFEELATSHVYYVIGSWTGFQTAEEMKKDQETGNFSREIVVGKSGTESFQILLNGNVLAAVHPAVDNATMYDGDHALEGPNSAGEGKCWAMGVHPKDQLARGDHVRIHLEVTGGLPQRVWWEKYDSPDAHREYLAWGCERIFERHCKLLGFVPYQSKERPARRVGRADFMEPGAETGIQGATMPLSLME